MSTAVYCKLCDARLRLGLRPDPACLECRHLAAKAAGRTEQLSLDFSDELEMPAPRPVPRTVPQTSSRTWVNDYLHGNRTEPPASHRQSETLSARRTVTTPPLARAERERGGDRLRGHLVCSTCRRLVLPSDARPAGDRIFCANCFASLPRCRACSAPITEGQGSALCPDCLALAIPCEGCETMLLPEELFVCDGRSFCESCYDRLEECDLCGSKVYDYEADAPFLLCAECRPHYSPCEICGAIIPNGEIRSVDGHGVCPVCLDTLDECEDCGAPVFAMPEEEHPPRLCAACLDHYVLCDLCHDPIPLADAERYIVDDRVLCENCYDDLPECEECLAHFFPDGKEEHGTTVCRSCREEFTHCDACGAKMRFTDAYERGGRLICEACNRKYLDK